MLGGGIHSVDSRLVINDFPNNLYMKRKYSPSCLGVWKQIYGLPSAYEHTKQSTFQNVACFTIFGQFHNGGSTKSNPNPNPSKNHNL